MEEETTDSACTRHDEEMSASGDGTDLSRTTAIADGEATATTALAVWSDSRDAAYPPEGDWNQEGSRHAQPREDHMNLPWQRSMRKLEKAKEYNEQ